MKISGFVLAVVGVAVVAACSSSDAPGGSSTAGAGGAEAGAASAGSPGHAGATAGAPSAGTGASGAPGEAGAPSEGGDAGSGGAAPTCTKCPSQCCDAGARCMDDGLGNLSCKKICATSAQCPASAQCCELQKDGSGICGSDSNVLCRCATGAECSSKACAPNVDAQGNPAGPYVCVANDGAAYHGCNGILTSCGGTTCCFTDAKANQFCASQCTNNSQCGAAACVTYSNANTTCGGMLGCGPK